MEFFGNYRAPPNIKWNRNLVENTVLQEKILFFLLAWELNFVL
jgi:hypothetical protein